MVIQPHRIEPGWLKRWTKQTLGLYMRNPLIPLFILSANVLGLLSIAQFPAPIVVLFFPFAVLTTVTIYSSLRALDRNSSDAIPTIWAYLKGSVYEIYRLMVYALIFAVLITLVSLAIIPILQLIISSQNHARAAIHYSRDYVTIFTVLLMAFESIFLLSLRQSTTLFIYLTLMIGDNYHENTALSQRAVTLNIDSIPMILLGFVIIGVSILLPVVLTNSTLFATVSAVVTCALFMFFCSFMYMASREIFEGQRENQKQEATVKMGSSLLTEKISSHAS